MASTGNVSALLKQLSSASQTLNEASNKLTEQIKQIEESLGSYNLGIVTWVDLRKTTEEIDPSVPQIHRVERLGYSKRNGKWALYASSSVEEFEDDESWLLRDAPRDLRILAVDAIPRLLEAMVAKAKELTVEVTSKTERAKTIAQSLRNKPKKGE